MFPSNPLFVDKMLQSRQEEIERGIRDYHAYDFQQTSKSPGRLSVKARIWASVGVFLVLAWLLHALM